MKINHSTRGEATLALIGVIIVVGHLLFGAIAYLVRPHPKAIPPGKTNAVEAFEQ